MSSTTCAPFLRRCCTTRPITRRPPPCALPSLPRPGAPKPPGASRPPASPTTACRCTASTYVRIQATTVLNDKYVFTLHTRPTPLQKRAFELLAVNPDRTQQRDPRSRPTAP